MATDDEPKELDWDDVDQVDLIGLEIRVWSYSFGKPRKWWSTYGACKGYLEKLSAELGFSCAACED